ncbi:MAG: F0F1 ATP synthase subunit alpha, partial [Candidatus Poribacteria bacterium]
MEPGLFYAGVRPAMNVGLSVSRLMGNAQSDAMKQVCGPLRAELARFRETQAFAQFGADQLDAATRHQLERGVRMTELLKQPQYEPMPQWKQILSIFAGREGHCDEVAVDDVHRFEGELHEFFQREQPDMIDRLEQGDKFTDEELAALTAAFETFKQSFTAPEEAA